jgi:hypothetical protein
MLTKIYNRSGVDLFHLQGERISNPIDNCAILWFAWAFPVIPVNQNSYELLTFSRFLLNN